MTLRMGQDRGNRPRRVKWWFEVIWTHEIEIFEKSAWRNITAKCWNFKNFNFVSSDHFKSPLDSAWPIIPILAHFKGHLVNFEAFGKMRIAPDQNKRRELGVSQIEREQFFYIGSQNRMRNLFKISSTLFRWKLNFCIQVKYDSSKRYFLTFLLWKKALRNPLILVKTSARLIDNWRRYLNFLSPHYLGDTLYEVEKRRKYFYDRTTHENIEILLYWQ